MKTTQTCFLGNARRAQRGQSMVEYAVICGLLAVALFAPVPGQGKAVGALLTDAIHTFYANLTNFVSLP